MTQETEAPAVAEMGVISLFKLLRPHQWVKNAFVAAPLFFHTGCRYSRKYHSNTTWHCQFLCNI